MDLGTIKKNLSTYLFIKSVLDDQVPVPYGVYMV